MNGSPKIGFPDTVDKQDSHHMNKNRQQGQWVEKATAGPEQPDRQPRMNTDKERKGRREEGGLWFTYTLPFRVLVKG